MTIEELYSVGNKILKFTDYEIEFLTSSVSKSSQKSDDSLIKYLMSVEKQPDSTSFQPLKVTANIATQPHRFKRLLEMLKSIEGQFDEIRIYLNNFSTVPPELSKYTTYIGKDLTDNGKFFWSHNSSEYYFTLNDDIIYPPDYVKKTLPLIKDRIVTYQGRCLFGLNQTYYGNHKFYTHCEELTDEVLLDVGSTGFMAFNTNLFKPNLWRSPNKKMSDLIVSLEATIFNIDMICLPKNEDWILQIDNEEFGISSEFFREDEKQTILSDMILTYKSQNTRLDRKYLALTFNKNSTNIFCDYLNENMENSKNFYHFGCTDGSTLLHISKLINFENYIGIETCDERVGYSFMNCGKTYDRYKFHFFNQSYDKVSVDKDSIVLMNDYVLLDHHSNKVWSNLPNGTHFITTKILNQIPVSKFKITTKNEVDVDYFYYIKSSDDLENKKINYEKTLIINMDDNELSKKRYEMLGSIFYHFNNPDRFIASKGRVPDYRFYVLDEWNKKLIGGDDKYIRMSDGEVGCCMSHLGVWKKVIEDDLEMCLVIEDDALKIIPNFQNIIFDLYKKLPEDWDVFLIGFSTFNETCKKVSEDIYKVKDFILTHCYLINKSGAKKLIESLPINAPLDTFMSSVSNYVNIYRHNHLIRRDVTRKTSYLINQYGDVSQIKHTNIIES
jgi:GR25 family glycosyltransferase involved in LPS biosynthesis